MQSQARCVRRDGDAEARVGVGVGVGVTSRQAWAWRAAMLLSCHAAPHAQAQPSPPVHAVRVWDMLCFGPAHNGSAQLLGLSAACIFSWYQVSLEQILSEKKKKKTKLEGGGTKGI